MVKFNQCLLYNWVLKVYLGPIRGFHVIVIYLLAVCIILGSFEEDTSLPEGLKGWNKPVDEEKKEGTDTPVQPQHSWNIWNCFWIVILPWLDCDLLVMKYFDRQYFIILHFVSCYAHYKWIWIIEKKTALFSLWFEKSLLLKHQLTLLVLCWKLMQLEKSCMYNMIFCWTMNMWLYSDYVYVLFLSYSDAW